LLDEGDKAVGLWGKRDDMVVHEVDPYNAEPPAQGLADRLLTPIGSFYSRNHGTVPNLDPTAWRLVVDGLVSRPLEHSLRQLQDSFEHQEITATLQCAGNRRSGFIEVRDIPGEDPWASGATSTATWTGVRLADVLTAAGVRDEAAHIEFVGPDVAYDAHPVQPYGGSIETEKAMAGEVLLAWAMNGAPLPPEHGAPVRVVVPGYIGARSVKWVERITARREPSDNYFQAVAYRLSDVPLGALALSADILRPNDGAIVAAGPTEITGYALAGDGRGVAAVEVSVDAGATWVSADLDESAGPWSWRLWRITVELQPGPVEVVARAWDTAGATQPQSAEEIWNPKGYINNSWAHIGLVAR
jgi:sulfite oxidase